MTLETRARPGRPWQYRGRVFRWLQPADVAWIMERWCDSYTVIPMDDHQRDEVCQLATAHGFTPYYFRGGIIALIQDEETGEARPPRRTPRRSRRSYFIPA